MSKLFDLIKKQITNKLKEMVLWIRKDELTLSQQVDRLKAENEELKQWQEDTEDILKTQLHNFYKIKNRYKQALDEIEEYLKTQLDGFGNAVYSVEKSAITKISDIINKAKEEE